MPSIAEFVTGSSIRSPTGTWTPTGTRRRVSRQIAVKAFATVMGCLATVNQEAASRIDRVADCVTKIHTLRFGMPSSVETQERKTMSVIKPMLASDWDEKKQKFPCIAQPKVDGVRGLNLNGGLTGRSLKKIGNKHTTALFSTEHHLGFDGEMFVGGDPCHPDLCRMTTSATTRISGTPDTKWVLFDYITADTIDLPYIKRLEALESRFSELFHDNWELLQNLFVTEWVWVHSLEELIEWDTKWLEMGYEGSITRDPNGKYKQGRSTVTEGGLQRIKRFIEADARVLSLKEGNTNTNEAQTNELGQTFRTSHQENMVPNGLLGSMECEMLEDAFDPNSKKLLLKKGQIITVAPGTMKETDLANYLANPDQIVGHVIKFKFFPKGVKDKPRFPQYQSHRAASDMVEI